MLTLVPPHTVITCIHSFSRPSCSTLRPCNCARVTWSFNHHHCCCLTHASINIYQNMQALDYEVVLDKVRWKEYESCWCSSCHFFHIWWKEVASVIDSEQELVVEALPCLLLVVQDLWVGSCSPCFLGAEILRKGSSQYILRYLLACIQLLQGSIIRSW